MTNARLSLRIDVSVAEEQEDLATHLLWEAGTIGIELQPDETGRVRLLAYFEPGSVRLDEIEPLLAPLQHHGLRTTAVPDEDWVATMRAAFTPVCAGGFRIVPAWSGELAPDDDHTLVVDPGRAFGTGSHETTQLCLDFLESAAAQGPLGRLIDVGSGTALLAIAAERLDAWAVGVDVDPDAVASARHHARLNHSSIHIVHGDGGRAFAHGSFSTFVANLTTPMLVQRRVEWLTLCASPARLVLSGFLLDDIETLVAAYGSAGTVSVRTRGQWAAMLVSLP